MSGRCCFARIVGYIVLLYVSCNLRIYKQVTILRDSGALQSLMLEGVIPVEETGKKVLVTGLWGLEPVPLVKVKLQSDLVCGDAMVGVVSQLPMSDVDLLLGNDLAGGKMSPVPVLSVTPVESIKTKQLEENNPELFPVCAVTRVMAAQVDPEVRAGSKEENGDFLGDDLNALFADSVTDVEDDMGSNRQRLVKAQHRDLQLQKLLEDVESEDDPSSAYYVKN